MYSSDKSALKKQIQVLKDDEAKAINVVAAAPNEDDEEECFPSSLSPWAD